MLRFAHSEYLYALWLLPVLGAGLWFIHLRRKALLQRFISFQLISSVAGDYSVGKRIIKETILLIALACFILGVANPQIGTRLEEVKRKGIDLVVALDVSLSMKSEDIKPSRLEKAKKDVSDLLRRLHGDRVGMIVFAGEAFVQFPLTADYSAADLFISAVDVESVPTPGTMIGNAIELAQESFNKDQPTQKAIIVVSDGENTEGDVIGAVEKAKAGGVKVFCIGQGTPEGGPIPIYQNGVRVDYKRDRSGSIVLSKLDETMLQQIASATGGSYRRATSGGDEVGEIFNELSKIEKSELGTVQISGFEDRYQYPLFLGILLLMIDVVLSERRGRLLTKLARFFPTKRAIILVVIFLGASVIHSQTVRSHIAKGNDAYKGGKYSDAEVEYKKALEKDANSRQARFNLGNTDYKQQRFEESIRAYESAAVAAKNNNERAAAYHNLGNAMVRSQQLPQAVEAYKRALRLNPNDEDTRYNLQYAMQMMKQQKQQQKQQQQKQDDQKEQQKQQQQQQQQRSEQSKQDQTRQQQAQQKKEQMQRAEAERILAALKNNEREIQKQLRKHVGARIRTEKDW
jgi:Ca-activated chloride channel family protein